MEEQLAPRSESRKKTKLVQVRCTPEEKEALKARASAFGPRMSVGELCRLSIFSSQPKSQVDQSAIAELANTRADLGRLGGLLKGWLAGSFEQGVPQNPAEVASLLHQIEAAQRKVVDSIKGLNK